MKLLTTGEIAKQLNVDRDCVSYALRKIAIVPSGIAGQTRVFSESAVALVKEFLKRKETV
ncbi:MAG: helix-turn-helix domain-containing protein [Planctomycetes bacterium]|nr:helix-turn-helix domain-containing protein [Planctomycetota bacterium]